MLGRPAAIVVAALMAVLLMSAARRLGGQAPWEMTAWRSVTSRAAVPVRVASASVPPSVMAPVAAQVTAHVTVAVTV